MNTDIIDKAIAVATAAHKGQTRKGSNLPYIVHPMEAMSIVATESEDQEMLAAAALHDVVEDTSITMDELRAMFGDRVADMVGADSNPPHREGDTWYSRKQEAIDRLAAASRDAQMVAMGDKLSNQIVTAADDKAAAEVFYWGLMFGERGVANGSMPTGMADMDIRRKPKPKLKN